MDTYLYFIAIVFFSAVLRLLPHVIAPHGVGIDHWFWKAYIEEYRKKKLFPPVLPQFLLDRHQWYPPLFPLIMSKFPDVLFDRYNKVLAVFIDLARLMLLMVTAYLLTGRTTSMVGAGIVYAFTPILISYNVQLNPRGLAALFLDIIVLLLVWLIWHDGVVWGWALVALVSGLLLLTHKMTTQLFWFLCAVAGVIFFDWRLIVLIPVSIISALIISRGFYSKVLRHHVEIVKFWNRNWRWLTAHPVLESPIYGDDGYETPTKYFHTGVSGFLSRVKYLLGFNPWGWSVFIASLWVYGADPMRTSLTIEDAWMVQWLGVVLLFMFLTTIVPFMRCLGNGYLYGYNVSFPAGLLVAMIWGGLKHDRIVEWMLYGTLLICLVSIGLYFWKLKHSKTQRVDADMEHALQYLHGLTEGVVICFPQHWHDVVAYKTKKPVVWGAHGFGFDLVQPVFPRILKPISNIILDYKVQYLLTYDEYLPKNFLAELPESSLAKFGIYRLYTLK